MSTPTKVRLIDVGLRDDQSTQQFGYAMATLV